MFDSGSGLALSYNSGAPIVVSRNGAFTAATGVAIGAAYSVAVASQPTNPSQTCTVSNGTGTLGTANVTSIAVFCPNPVARFAYVIGDGNFLGSPVILGTISLYALDPTSGALGLVPASTVSTGPSVSSFTFVPRSRFAWAVNPGQVQAPQPYFLGSVFDYTVDPTTGLLTAVAGSPFSDLDGTSRTPSGQGSTFADAFQLSGAFGYVSNGAIMGANNAAVWQFSVNAMTGAPGLVPGTNIPTGMSPTGVTVDPSGQFAYVMAVPPTRNALVPCTPTL